MKKAPFLIVLMAALVLFMGCSGGDKPGENNSSSNKSEETSENLLQINFNVEGNEIELEKYETQNPVAALYVKGYGAIVIELYPDVAPNTVNNFISLIKKGFYDNNTIHRMQPGFVIQGGDPTGTGRGDPGYSIIGEFASNGFVNNLSHAKGVVSMARSSNGFDTAGCQFFIMLGDAPSLDGDYAAFGRVIDGFSNCEEIAKIKYYSLPLGILNENLVITKAVVDTKGKSYPEPETLLG
ncbi:MAG: peptidylprolyl isomerase [Eubacteriales bacterium]